MNWRNRGITAGLVAAIALAGGLLLGCGGAETKKDTRIRVVATTTMIGDLVSAIAGDRVELKVIIGTGVDPHTYKPSTGDLADMARAKMVFYNGHHLEGKMVELFETRLHENSIAVTRDIPEERLLNWQDGSGGPHDPHVWFDVMLWSRAAQTVRDGLIQIDPGGQAVYRQRTEELLVKFVELDSYARSTLASIPEEQRVLITSHDAYNYFGRAYGIEVRGLQGISTESEVGLKSVSDAVDFIIARKIPAIFVESSVRPETIQRVQADCRARGFEVAIGGELYSDAMGAPGEHPGYEVHTYVGMFRYNVDTIARGLKGGMQP